MISTILKFFGCQLSVYMCVCLFSAFVLFHETILFSATRNLSRLLDLDVSPSIVLWVRAFLRDRPQTVCVNSVKSNELILNTGAPQGCVLSPILFSIYTNEIISNTTTLTLIKFADDMALVARLKDEQSLSSYFNFIEHLISWFDKSYLKLNVKKNKRTFD